MHDTQRRLPDRHHRPDHRQARLDDGEHRERLRARPVPAATRRSATWRRTRSTRCTRRPCRADRRGARTRRTSAPRTRSATSSTATRSTANGACTKPGAGDGKLDDDDQVCLDGSHFGALIPIIGCVLDDGDFDGPSYQLDWPGTFQERGVGPAAARHPGPDHGATSGGKPLENVAFENDLPRIERGEPGNVNPQCDGATGVHCFNPPRGAKFYPIYTLTHSGGRCWLQQGGPLIPGTSNTFGGTSATEYGTTPLFVTYADAGWQADHAGRGLPPRPGRQPC